MIPGFKTQWRGDSTPTKREVEDKLTPVKQVERAPVVEADTLERRYNSRRRQWELATLVQSTGRSWLVTGQWDGKFALGCSLCHKAKVNCPYAKVTITEGNVSKIARHGLSQKHKESLVKLGLEEASAEQKAPSVEAFKAVAKSRVAGHSFSQGADGMGRRKVTKMALCLAETCFHRDREFLRSATMMALRQDVRQQMLLVRYSACSESLECRRGTLGMVHLDAGGNAALQAGIIQVVTEFCTEKFGLDGANLDSALVAHLKHITGILDADAASDEQLAGRLLRSSGIFPNVKVQMRDRTHASGRSVFSPCVS